MLRRKKKPELSITIDPIPSCNWYINLRKYLPIYIWKDIRKEVLEYFNYKCAVCGSTLKVECHEEWNISDRFRVQTLVGFILLCKRCHELKHWFRTVNEEKKGKISTKYYNSLIQHFLDVNEVDILVFHEHVEDSKRKVYIRKKYNYILSWGKFCPVKIEERWKKVQREKDPKQFLVVR